MASPTSDHSAALSKDFADTDADPDDFAKIVVLNAVELDAINGDLTDLRHRSYIRLFPRGQHNSTGFEKRIDNYIFYYFLICILVALRLSIACSRLTKTWPWIRGEKTAEALESNLTSLEKKIDDLLASFEESERAKVGEANSREKGKEVNPNPISKIGEADTTQSNGESSDAGIS
ncbi:hypothetical protein G7Y89_g3946 [Cudoniella acicularis]|uniref:Uncharacterized protein n=1 Tax=Cudoniella acicularis TaxID=354080 RepID=A0A8H4RTD6_9HELO|nr:hypothetical protein G7Y89_g3946 [Cudoniella acicularis]